MIMIKGMITALSAVAYTLGFLVIVTYVFGIALTQMARDTELAEDGAYLSCVALAMYSLTLHGTFLDDLADFADALKAQESPAMLITASVFIVLASMTIMNMLIGILCEVITEVARTENENILYEYVSETFQMVMQKLDKDEDGLVSYHEFSQIVDHPAAMQAFEQLKVDAETVVDFAQDWFLDEKGKPKDLDLQEFVDMVFDMRGGQPVTLKELMRMKKKLNTKFSEVGDVADSVEASAERLRGQILGKR